MPWYYICEYPELSLRWMRRALKWNLNWFPRENITGERAGQTISLSTLEQQTYEIIREKNDLDFPIYRYAVDRLLSQS
jgi:hypothetical protein